MMVSAWLVSVLARVQRRALVLVELNLQIYFRVLLDWLFGMELHIARFADGEGNRGALHDPETTLWHGHSFPQVGRPFIVRRTIFLSNIAANFFTFTFI